MSAVAATEFVCHLYSVPRELTPGPVTPRQGGPSSTRTGFRYAVPLPGFVIRIKVPDGLVGHQVVREADGSSAQDRESGDGERRTRQHADTGQQLPKERSFD